MLQRQLKVLSLSNALAAYYIICEEGELCVSDVSRCLGISINRATVRCKDLAECGLVLPRKKTRPGGYLTCLLPNTKHLPAFTSLLAVYARTGEAERIRKQHAALRSAKRLMLQEWG